MTERFPQIPMIGRQDMLDSICQKIEQNSGKREVICLYGPGGIGKTRMLQEIARIYNTPEKRTPKILSDAHIPRIILVQEDGRGEWSQEFLEGVKSMAHEFGINIDKDCYDAQGDIKEMERLICQAITLHPDILLIREGTKENIRNIINQAVKEGSKILTFDNYSQKLDPSITKVTHNESEGIQESAYKLRDEIRYAGDIAVICGADPLQKRRVELFKQFLHNDAYPDIHTVATRTITSQGSNIPNDVKKQIRQTLNEQRNIKAFWTTCSSLAKPLFDLLKELNRQDILIYSFDLDQEVIEFMTMDGSPWKMTTTTEPYKSGRILVRIAMQKIGQEKNVPANYELEPRLISQIDLLNNREIRYEDDEKAWTPKLRSLISKEKPISQLIETITLIDIFDFDDRGLRNPERLEREIAKHLDVNVFELFLQAQTDYFKMQKYRVSENSLKSKQKDIENIFCACFNRYTQNVRPVLLFDTFDKEILPKDCDIWKNFNAKLPQFQNTVIIIAGRDADKFGQLLQPVLEDDLEIIKLRPLSVDDCKTYLQQKARQMYIIVEDEIAGKLIFLSGGKPILLDLAVEMRGRGLSLNWLATETLDELYLLNNDSLKREKRLKEFEYAIVNHIADLRQPFDELVLLLSYVNPLNEQMLVTLLDISQEEAKALFEKARQYIFIKTLPNGFIKLHDEMERMINENVWQEIDPENFRKTLYSKQAYFYLTEEITKAAQILSEKLKESSKFEQYDTQNEKHLESDLDIQELKDALWLMKEQQLHYALLTDLDNAIENLFVELFDEANDNPKLQQNLFIEIQKYENKFQPHQRIVRDIHQIKLWSDKKECYQEAINRCQNLLIHRIELSKEETIDIFILQGNLNIRLGDNNKGIADFTEALEISKDNQLSMRRIHALNALGWAYRQLGDLEKALKYYIEARGLCLQEGEPNKKGLQETYGWILNNLAFVLSNDKKTSQTAIDIARDAVEHWQSIDHEIGLGAGYSMLGIAYYRTDLFIESALEEFSKALEIFKRLKLNDWLGQVYSWRGALFLHLRRLEEAEQDLNQSLAVGSPNIEAMTLNRLGRVYMSKGDQYQDKDAWDKANEYMQRGLERAKDIRDYVYWLGSLARLATIAAEKEEYHRLDEFCKQLDDFLKEVKTPDKSALGQMYVGLAKLGFGKNEASQETIEQIINFLKEGIPLIVEHGPYSRTDILKRLAKVEKDFSRINPEIIHKVGSELQEHFSQLELENAAYSPLVSRMHKWAIWEGK